MNVYNSESSVYTMNIEAAKNYCSTGEGSFFQLVAGLYCFQLLKLHMSMYIWISTDCNNEKSKQLRLTT